jgi:predicted DCC family thiol-disulfide oxidoreductase YuxK
MREGQSVLLYDDDDCVLCCWSANLVASRDRHGRLWYAGLGSERGRELLARHGFDPASVDSVVLIESSRAYTDSTAALRALAALPAPWSWAGFLLLVPPVVRDAVYAFVSRNRHRLPSRSCPTPHPRLRQHLLT